MTAEPAPAAPTTKTDPDASPEPRPLGPAAGRSDADRLARLWEAYKVQEEELREANARAERLVRDLTDAGAATMERERLVAEKDAEIRRLQETIAHKDARIQDLLALEDDAKAIQMYKDRIAELEAAHAQEKERLAKLFLLYEQATKQ